MVKVVGQTHPLRVEANVMEVNQHAVLLFYELQADGSLTNVHSFQSNKWLYARCVAHISR